MKNHFQAVILLIVLISLAIVPTTYAGGLMTDMGITMSEEEDPVVAGYSVYYDMSVTNNGPQATTGVVVTIPDVAQTTFVTGSPACSHGASAVTCSLGNMTVFQTIDLQIELHVNNNASGPLDAVASVASANTDPMPGNNSAEEFTAILVGPPTPTALTPVSGSATTNLQPIFTWTAIPGAIAYDIGLDIQDPPSITYRIYTTTFRLPGPMIYTTYHWQVRALNSNNVPSPWSPMQTVRIDPLPDAAPFINAYSDFDVPLTWNRVPGALGYQIQFSDNVNFEDYAPMTAELPRDQLSYNISFYNGTWYWRVHARQPDGNWGPWSTTTRFQVIVP